MNAVDSEHEKNLMNDAWRLFQLEKATGNPKHPFSKFGTGRKKPQYTFLHAPYICWAAEGCQLSKAPDPQVFPGATAPAPGGLGADSWVKDGPVGADVSVWRLNKCSRVYLHEQPLTLYEV